MEQKRILQVAIFMICFIMGAQAQSEIAFNEKGPQKGAFNEDLTLTKEDVKKDIPYYYRYQKKLPSFYTGIVIELTTSDLPLRRDYFIFERFGNIMMTDLEDGGFSYVIDGFKDEQAARTFLNNIVKHSAPEAKIIMYKKGKRKKKK